jgi:flagellar biosynthesis/type III secretory pathway chaperone
MNSFEELIKALEKEMKLYEKLYVFLEKDFGYVTSLDRSALSLNNSKKEHILEQLFRVSQKRDFYVSEISGKHAGGEKLSLREIIKIAPDDLKEQFKHLHKSFLSLVEKVKKKNEYNKEYITMSIKRLRAITSNLYKYQKTDNTYDKKGKVSDSSSRSFVAKEA